MKKIGRVLIGVVLLSGFATSALPQSLKIADRNASKTVTAQHLLADPAAREIVLDQDSVYGRAMTYHAIPASDLLKGLAIGPEDYVEFTAVDRFSIGVPARLLLARDSAGPLAFLAIETAARPWPAIPDHGKQTPAPFYLVWQNARPAEVSSEYWVYKLASLEVTDSPFKLWPSLTVADDLPASHPARRGLDRYVALCISCHRFKGAGNGEQGPDLGQPMNPVDYFQLPALKKFLRSSKSVRDWPDRKMPSFVEEMLSDHDIDAIIAWLRHKARQ